MYIYIYILKNVDICLEYYSLPLKAARSGYITAMEAETADAMSQVST